MDGKPLSKVKFWLGDRIAKEDSHGKEEIS